MLSGCGGGFKAADLASSDANRVTSTLACTPNTQQSCQTGNGTGSQTCNSSGSAWGACGNFTSCDSGFNLQNGACVANACTPNTQQSCQTGNGTGSQSCNVDGSAWGVCGNITNCNSGFNLQNGVCVANVCNPNAQQSCQAGNGTGSQTCNGSGSAWGACGNIASCNSGYSLYNGACYQSISLAVEDFGARADGSVDSTAAIQNAINTAMQLGIPAEVVLSSGTYRLDCASSNPGACFNILGAHNLTLRGQGASTQLLIANPIMGLITVNNSTDITISGFSVDYSSLPFTQGTIQNVSGNAIDLAVDPGFPGLDQPIFAPNYLAQTFAMLFDPGTPTLKGSAGNYFVVNSIAKNGDGTFHVGLSGVAGVAVGDRFALSNRSNQEIVFAGTNNITLRQVTFYAGPGAASVWVGNRGRIIIDDFEVRRKPGTNRLISTAADAIHMLNNAAKLTIENCFIEGMGDDALNTRSEAFSIGAVSSATTYQLSSATPLAVGYTLQVVDPATQLAKGTARITSLQVQADNTETVTVDQAIPNAAAGDMIFSEDLASPNALIRNNTFSNFRGIFRIRSSGAIFANNQILDPRNAFVLIGDDIEPSWQEGPTLVNSLNGVYFNNNVVRNGSISVVGANNAIFGAPALSGDSALLTHPLVFNTEVYRLLNPDLATFSDQDLMSHWLAHGIFEGRQASIGFHPSEYLQLYSDLSTAFGSTNFLAAINHYLSNGATLELRQGSIYTNSLVYNSADYRSNNPDLASWNDTEVGIHWLLHGIDEGRRASATFYSRDYLNRYPDLQSALGATNYRSAVNHFVLHGFSEGLDGI
jgi:hypothetical protein